MISTKTPNTKIIKRKSTPKRTYRCVGFEGCDVVFTRAEHLTRHRRKHTGEKPYKCDICNKNFSRVDNLKQHTDCVHSQYKKQKINNNNNNRNILISKFQEPTPEPIISSPIQQKTNIFINNNTNIDNSNNNNALYIGNSYKGLLSPQSTTINNAWSDSHYVIGNYKQSAIRLYNNTTTPITTRSLTTGLPTPTTPTFNTHTNNNHILTTSNTRSSNTSTTTRRNDITPTGGGRNPRLKVDFLLT